MAQNETVPELTFRKLELQYQECCRYGRFYAGVRFSFAASFVTLFIILIGGYHYVRFAGPALGPLQPHLLFATAIFGTMTSFAAVMIERRNIYLYRTSDQLAVKLETQMGIVGGLYQTLTRRQARTRFLGIPVTHTVAISIGYASVMIIWLILVVDSVVVLRP